MREAHRFNLPVAHNLAAAQRAALHEAVAVQLGQPHARHTRAQVQPVHILADDVGNLPSLHQCQQRLSQRQPVPWHTVRTAQQVQVFHPLAVMKTGYGVDWQCMSCVRCGAWLSHTAMCLALVVVLTWSIGSATHTMHD